MAEVPPAGSPWSAVNPLSTALKLVKKSPCRAGPPSSGSRKALKSMNPDKAAAFPVDTRVSLAREVLAHIVNVEVCSFDNLLVDFVRQREAGVILRGLRAVSDFEYEFQLAGMNRHLAPEIETLFLTPAEQYAYISSSLVREIASLGGDVTPFAHRKVVAALRGRMN